MPRRRGLDRLRRFIVQLLLPILAVVVAFLLVAAFYWSRAFERLHVDSLTGRLEREARLVSDALPWGVSGEGLDRLCRIRAREIDGRVTVIADDGKVLGESEEPSESLENHGQRPEIVHARGRGVGTSVRLSHTVGEAMLYVAVADRRDTEQRFVRLGLPLRSLGESRRLVRSILGYGFLAALLLGGGVALLVSRRLAARVRRIEAYSRQIATGAALAGEPAPDDELDALEQHLVGLAHTLRARLIATEDERAKLEAVLRSMVDGVIVIDGDGRIVLCNRYAVEQLELPPAEESVGARLSFLCRHPDLAALVDDVLGGAGEAHQREIALAGRAESRVLSASGSPIAEEGQGHGAILVLHDVTRLRRLEEMRADFVANVSHELRTPLTAIRGYAETLLNGAIDHRDKAVQFLQVIDRHSERLARLIDDLLTLSDLELGKTEIRRRPVAVAELVGAALELVRHKADGRSIDLVPDVPEEIPELLVDPDRIEEVLINLVDNAIKYSGPGTRVTVRARQVSTGGGREGVELAVVDQGIGIPEKEIPRLTERFYRVDRARSRELGGTGLGLAIVKHIVQAHEGSLEIVSSINEGTTVKVVLPAAATAAAQDRSREGAAHRRSE